MKDTHYRKVNTGRGFGGTGFVFNKEFTPFLRPLIRFESERISVMELNDAGGPIIIVNVYCPYKQSGDEHRVQYLEVLGAIENVLNSHAAAKFVILGDFNYNIRSKATYVYCCQRITVAPQNTGREGTNKFHLLLADFCYCQYRNLKEMT